ncbi:MAG: hypothetical protein ACI9KE_004982, partial [Polyangiales bacterium]
MLQPIETSNITEKAWKSDHGTLRIHRPFPEVLVFI